jgi:hypothetical protein
LPAGTKESPFPDGTYELVFGVPRGAIGVKPKRMWHDFEAVLYYAFRFDVAKIGFAEGPTRRGRNQRPPYFGGDAHPWTQFKPTKTRR